MTGSHDVTRARLARTQRRSRRPGWFTGSVVLAAVVTTAAVGCGDGDGTEPDVTEPGLANPASEFCVEQGGEVEIVDEGGGQVGYCLLPDGRRIEEWEFYRAETGATTEP